MRVKLDNPPALFSLGRLATGSGRTMEEERIFNGASRDHSEASFIEQSLFAGTPRPPHGAIDEASGFEV